MANTHLGHIDLAEEDIIENGVLNEPNLDILDNQISELSCYDKVGAEYYNISKHMSFSETNRSIDFVLGWLRHLEELPITSKNVGYLGRCINK